jgi:shikimate kinase
MVKLRETIVKIKQEYASELALKIQEATKERDATRDELAKLQKEHEQLQRMVGSKDAIVSTGGFASMNSKILQLETY